MMATRKRLLTTTAQDLMSRDVVTIPAEMSLRAAARRLIRARVSGAPVMDGAGLCIGVLSSSDFVTWAEESREISDRETLVDFGHTEWSVPDIEKLPQDAVSQYMTRDVVTAEPLTPIAELARTMVDAHIHRLIIVDRENRPVGVISSMDILAAVAAEASLEDD